MRRSVEALRDELLVAVSPGMNHTVAATRGCSVFGWGEAKGLGLPEAASEEVAQPGEDDDDEEEERECVMSSHRYPQLTCGPRSCAI